MIRTAWGFLSRRKIGSSLPRGVVLAVETLELFALPKSSRIADPCFLHSTLAVNDPMGAPPNRRPVATAHVGLNQPVDHESWRDVDTVLATPSRVDAARMQRTLTPEYMCQGCDRRCSFTVMRSSPAWSSRSSSLPKVLTENGQVGSRNTSKMRARGPRQADQRAMHSCDLSFTRYISR